MTVLFPVRARYVIGTASPVASIRVTQFLPGPRINAELQSVVATMNTGLPPSPSIRPYLPRPRSSIHRSTGRPQRDAPRRVTCVRVTALSSPTAVAGTETGPDPGSAYITLIAIRHRRARRGRNHHTRAARAARIHKDVSEPGSTTRRPIPPPIVPGKISVGDIPKGVYGPFCRTLANHSAQNLWASGCASSTPQPSGISLRRPSTGTASATLPPRDVLFGTARSSTPKAAPSAGPE